MAETNSSNANTSILVTGGSGFLSLHIIAQALAAGYKVRTTIRSEAKKDIVLKGLANASPPVDSSQVSFVTADLVKDAGWADAVAGTTYVIHAASPFPKVQPDDEDEVIRPAVDGTLRVLKAAKAAGTVRRIILTSSVAAISNGRPFKDGQVYTEADWSDPNTKDKSSITPYAKSKTLAEKAAWDFISKEGGDLELTTVNPVGIFGPPLLLPADSVTVGIVQQILDGALPAVPDVRFAIVDVRDAAALHLLVATRPEAKGQRYVCTGSGQSASFQEISGMLRAGLGKKARKAPTRVLPNVAVRLIALVMPQLRQILGQLGRRQEYSAEKAEGLGWKPRGNEEAIVSCGQALIDAGIVK